jgi:hypothetical protein
MAAKSAMLVPPNLATFKVFIFNKPELKIMSMNGRYHDNARMRFVGCKKPRLVRKSTVAKVVKS